MRKNYKKTEVKIGDDVYYRYIYDYDYIRMKRNHERKEKLKNINAQTTT